MLIVIDYVVFLIVRYDLLLIIGFLEMINFYIYYIFYYYYKIFKKSIFIFISYNVFRRHISIDFISLYVWFNELTLSTWIRNDTTLSKSIYLVISRQPFVACQCITYGYSVFYLFEKQSSNISFLSITWFRKGIWGRNIFCVNSALFYKIYFVKLVVDK